jgi:hypothetical protein
MTFGTVFATKTSSVAAASATTGNKLTLSPTTGAITESTAVVGAPVLKTLLPGAAGVYTSPGLPANATVKVTISHPVSNLAITNASSSALATCAFADLTAADTAQAITLTHSSGDTSLGFFCVDAFTSDKLTILGAGQALGFGVTTLTFNLGATLVQQSTVNSQKLYEAGLYSGQFGLEVSFP